MVEGLVFHGDLAVDNWRRGSWSASPKGPVAFPANRIYDCHVTLDGKGVRFEMERAALEDPFMFVGRVIGEGAWRLNS